MIAASEVDQFYEDSIRGVYKKNPKLAAENKLKIEKAIRENRVDMNR